MKKHILAGLLLGASVMATAHTSIVDKTITEGVRDSAVDTNGNLFAISGDGAWLRKYDHNGNVVWSQNFGLEFKHVAVDSTGQVGAAYQNNTGIGIIWMNGFTGNLITNAEYTIGSSPDEVFDLVGGDNFYVAFREGNDSALWTSTSSLWTVDNTGAGLEPSASPLGGVAVAVRTSTVRVNKYDVDGMGQLVNSWNYVDGGSSLTASRNIRINHRADGKLLVGYINSSSMYYGICLSAAGAFEYSNEILTNDAAYGDIPKPVSLNGKDVFFDFYHGSLEALAEHPSFPGDFYPYVLGPATEPGVCVTGTKLALFGTQVSMFDSSFDLEAQSNWTLPTGRFDSFARPDGSIWVTEKGATNTRIIRFGAIQKVVKDMFVMNEDQAAASFNVLMNDTISWVGGTTTVEWQSLPNNATLGAVSNEATNGTFTFTPAADQSGAVDFQYRVVNTVHGSTAWQNVRVVVKPVNDRPVGVADNYTIGRGQLLTVNAAQGVISNDTDADSHTLTAVFHRGPQRGTLNLASDGSFTYQAPSQPGTYTFLYRAKDVQMHCAPVTVTITVN